MGPAAADAAGPVTAGRPARQYLQAIAGRTPAIAAAGTVVYSLVTVRLRVLPLRA